MALRFVKTEILSSSDGISHSDSKAVESEEVVRARRGAGGSGKTLFEQLEAEKGKQQEAYDANTKLIFAPPASLEREDIEFFAREERKRRRDERSELESFAAERAKADGEAAEARPPPKDRPRRDAAPAAAAPAVKLRRKPLIKRHKAEDAKRPSEAPRPKGGLASLVGLYDDDDDSE